MRRDELKRWLALVGVVIVIAVLAMRFDFTALLFENAAPHAKMQRVTATKRPVTVDSPDTRAEPRGVQGEQKPTDNLASRPVTTFDVVRIAPDGVSVFAGRAPANALVTVLANGQPVATAEADSNGEWSVVIDRQYAPGEYQLSLNAKLGKTGEEIPGQSARITIAASESPKLASAKTTGVPLQSQSQAPTLPAPIPFAYDDASFANVGNKQAAAISEFLRQRRPESVTLTGHADERGTDEHNMALSRLRLESVARYLRESGYVGKLTLVPKGKSEPFLSPDRARLPQDQIFQLDRRVELRSAQ